MKKTILVLLSLIACIPILSCASFNGVDPDNEIIKQKLETYQNELSALIDYCAIDDQFGSSVRSDTLYPADFLDVYDNQRYDYIEDRCMNYPLITPNLLLFKVLQDLTYEIPLDGITVTVELTEDHEIYYAAVYIKDFEGDAIYVKLKSNRFDDTEFLFSYDDSDNFRVDIRIRSTYSESGYHAIDSLDFFYATNNSDGSDRFQYVNFRTKRNFASNNDATGSWTELYDPANKIAYFMTSETESIEFFNQQGRFLAYEDYGDSLRIGWQLLEATGWTYAQKVTWMSWMAEGAGIFVDDVNIFDPSCDTLASFIYDIPRPRASLFLSKTLPKGQWTDGIADLSDYGLDMEIEGLSLTFLANWLEFERNLVETYAEIENTDYFLGLIDQAFTEQGFN